MKTGNNRPPRWTDHEKQTLARLYSTMPIHEVAAKLNRPLQGCYVMAHKLGLKKGQPNKIRLSDTDRLWLRLNYPHIANDICAIKLGISKRTVNRIASAMGLQKTSQFMREAQALAAHRARESHLRNGTYPPKGIVNDNLAKGAQYRFKPRKEKIRI